jgi:hypothetical protein
MHRRPVWLGLPPIAPPGARPRAISRVGMCRLSATEPARSRFGRGIANHTSSFRRRRMRCALIAFGYWVSNVSFDFGPP